MTSDMANEKEQPKKENIPELFIGMANAKPEEDEIVCNWANETGVALIAFISPYVYVRVSPIESVAASISLADEFGVETVVNELRKANIKKAYLLVNSLGGAMGSSYKIARALRMCLDEITVFVPHIAASGGTLLALTGNRIVMGPMSHITPLDVQIGYKGANISMATFQRFFVRASRWFERVTPEEAPYPQRAMADMLDPFIMEEWSGIMSTAVEYVDEILKLSGYKEHKGIAETLVAGFPTHAYVITPDKGKDMGLNIEDSSKFDEEWKIMRYWLGKYLMEEATTHCIRYAIPKTTVQ
jgi:ATP-dependent protease ClpP protease subunit